MNPQLRTASLYSVMTEHSHFLHSDIYYIGTHRNTNLVHACRHLTYSGSISPALKVYIGGLAVYQLGTIYAFLTSRLQV